MERKDRLEGGDTSTDETDRGSFLTHPCLDEVQRVGVDDAEDRKGPGGADDV